MREHQIREAIALRALEEYGERLMSYPNVVGLGLGEEQAESELGYVVKVYVSRKANQKQLRPNERIPSNLPIRSPNDSKKIVLVPTAIEEIGDVELETT